MFPGPLGASLAGRALATGLWQMEVRDIRDSATDRHRSVDDTRPAAARHGAARRRARRRHRRRRHRARPPASGHEPARSAIDPGTGRGSAAGPGPLIVCGRFEGIDQRVIDARGLEEVSIGDYVLSGGEIAAMVLLDACVRLVPGVMGSSNREPRRVFRRGSWNIRSTTRPQSFEGRPIPDVLTSGYHARVAAWRREQAES